MCASISQVCMRKTAYLFPKGPLYYITDHTMSVKLQTTVSLLTISVINIYEGSKAKLSWS